jgi:hypothetical protein
VSERVASAPLSVNRLDSGLIGGLRQSPECFQRSQVQILPPLQKTGPDLRKRRAQGLLDLDRCPQTVHIRSRPRARREIASDISALVSGLGSGGFEPFRTGSFGFKSRTSQAVEAVSPRFKSRRGFSLATQRLLRVAPAFNQRSLQTFLAYLTVRALRQAADGWRGLAPC